MPLALRDLIYLSRLYGAGKDFVIAGGGNTSLKDEARIAIKASGRSLRDITERGFVLLDRKAVREILAKSYSEDPWRREEEIKGDLLASRLEPEQGLRPSVETSLHEMIRYRYVVHTHPYRVNALLCSREAEKAARRLCGGTALYLPYTDPGYSLAKRLEAELGGYRASHRQDPKIVLMQNHGLVVAADSAEEIELLTRDLVQRLQKGFRLPLEAAELPLAESIKEVLPALRMMLGEGGEAKIVSIRHDTLIAHFLRPENRRRVSLPFTPDNIVYCKASPLWAPWQGDPEAFLVKLPRRLERYRSRWGYAPKILLIPGLGLAAAESSKTAADTCLDVFEDLMKVSFLTDNFGGPRFLTEANIAFIDSWEVESYRRSVAKGGGAGRLAGRIALVADGSGGLGGKVAEGLFAAGANLVVAGAEESAGKNLAEALNRGGKPGKAIFVRCDLTDPVSLEDLATRCVEAFGGLDLLVCAAEAPGPGGLAEVMPEDFEPLIRLNLTGYYLCVRQLVPLMKLQHRFRQDRFADIIQINCELALEGASRAFAAAGSGCGGLGLTQSFALELAEHRIKVNAVCPGSFREDPGGAGPGEAGMRNIPLKRGWRIEDLMRAILYLIEQEYETGQALPLTGGRIMLS